MSLSPQVEAGRLPPRTTRSSCGERAASTRRRRTSRDGPSSVASTRSGAGSGTSSVCPVRRIWPGSASGLNCRRYPGRTRP
ncbi:MAG: hypothetical protein ABIJ39_01295 [Chloroflexota bacterium]